MEKIYLTVLKELKKTADEIPNTRMMALAKISTLVTLNMRYERIMLERQLEIHPYELVANFVQDAVSMLSAWREVSFIEEPSAPVLETAEKSLEAGHHDLFQQLWIHFSPEEYNSRIERYQHRLRINGLSNGWLKGFKCIDFGCGHGNFAHALVREGAEYVCGVDFGEESIEYAKQARDKLGIPSDQIEFKVESVYDVSTEDESFDFAIQNGVFHHLEDEDAAYREVWRVLKPGAWFWVYTDGAGNIGRDLWNASTAILKNVPKDFTISHLQYLNIETGKRYHLGDGMNAVYRSTTWEELTERLKRLGFGNFRRLVGGFPTDFDHDVIAADKYGPQKFGTGDLRLLAQKID